LWDVNLSDWENDSVSSRFGEEGWQERYVAFVKQITSKPVVGVGRFTSPDTMLSQIRRGVLDMIGAARPSIADPFLPEKIEQGRLDEIRECIGCNICVSGQHTFTPMRCTQNPSVGEEWRRGWHPERIAAKGSDAKVLVVGAGPAGLEAARALGQRGYAVTLAEAGTEPGGRVTHESRLPGLSAWARARDWRVGRIQEMTNVDVFLGSRLSAEDVLEYGTSHVVVATGAHWRADGVGVSNWQPIQGSDQAHVLTPENIYAGAAIADPVLVFDDDNFYMGAVIAEKLKGEGHVVALVTTASKVSSWTENTLEQHRIQARVLELGIEVTTAHTIAQIHADEVDCACIFTNRLRVVSAGSVVMVTSRQPDNKIYLALREHPEKLASAGIRSVSAIGDCSNPSTIATAIYDGHREARELDAAPVDPDMPFRREQIALASSV
jgi:dimethylamine/trimethylamine dehydrogenase